MSICEALAEKVKEYNPDILVGISRGGLVPVRLISDVLGNMEVAIVRIEFYKDIGKTNDFPQITQPLTKDIKGKRVLIVDDVADSGRSLKVAKEYILKQGAGEVKIATLHYKPISMFKPDYYIGTTEAWIIYPWEVHEVERQRKRMEKEKKSR